MRTVLLFVIFCILPLSAAAEPTISSIAATESELIVHIDAPGERPVALAELEPFEQFDPDGARYAWKGVSVAEVSIERFPAKRDRLYRKFQLVDHATRRPLGRPRYVTDLSALEPRTFDIPWYNSIKGLTCPVHLDDFIALGTKYAVDNAPVSNLIDWGNPDPEMSIEIDGQLIPINGRFVREWMDKRYKPLTDAGINITLVMCNLIPKQGQPGNPLHHPNTDFANAPMHYGGFNVTTVEGLRCLRAAFKFVAERYTRPDKRYGLISGIIVGNELQQHWVWHNVGEMPPKQVAEDYAIALRMADLAARTTHNQLRVYVSMDHHWTKRGYTNNELREISGDRLLKMINDTSRAEGNFPWHVAFHPYPENLFEPRFWLDRTVTMRLDTPKISFKNIEVLPAFLSQEEMLYQGKPRRIILSEQGFHTPDGPDGEKIQAACWAYAYHKLRHIPAIDAFMLHRHVDHRNEGGLKLGLWTFDPDEPSGTRPKDKKVLWDVFKRADTDEWEEAFAFALPMIGFESWDQALPHEIDMSPPPAIDEERLVYDFCDNAAEARLDNNGDLRSVIVIKAAGWAAPAIYHHPPRQGVGRAIFSVSLPEVDEDTVLTLRFETLFTAQTENGVRFSISVGEEELFATTQAKVTPREHAVDMTKWAGKTIDVALEVDGLGNTSYDWANWVQPRIMREPRKESVDTSKMEYIDNGTIKLGVNLELGGAITYIADSKSGKNLVNNWDWGRQIQMSFFAEPRPYVEKGQKPKKHWEHIGWNPIQAGDDYGNGSKTVQFGKNETSLHVKCIPMQWPLNNVPGECTYEYWIELVANTVQVRCRLNNARSDRNKYMGRHQELPAVYTNGEYYRLMTYKGDKPFTGDRVNRIPKKTGDDFPWTYWLATENWAALVDEDNWGLGIYKPDSSLFVGGFAGKEGRGGTHDSPTGYIAPLHTEILDHNITYDYDYTLILGSLADIRGYAVARGRGGRLPDWRFEKDRQHWHYAIVAGSGRSAPTDGGWPIKGHIHLDLTRDGTTAISPPTLWKADDAPVAHITAAFKTEQKKAIIAWTSHSSDAPNYAFNVAKSVGFDIVGDGRFRTYTVNLAGTPTYKGALSYLMLKPVPKGEKGAWVNLERIRLGNASEL